MSLSPWPEAILLDLDGTLVDSAPDLITAVNTMLAELDRPGADPEEVRLWVGNGAQRLIERALAGTQNPATAPPPALYEQAREAFFAAYQRCNGLESRLYPGVAEFLAQARARGSRLAVVTNKPGAFTGPLLEAMGIAPYFDVVLSGDSLTGADGEWLRKPDPAPLAEALRRLAIPRHKGLMIGDSRADIEAARALGLPVVAVTYGYSQGTDVASLASDSQVDSMTELL